MTGWIVVLAVIAFLLLLLLCPLCLSVSYEGEWKVKVRYLFVRYPLYPRKPSKKKEKKGKIQKDSLEKQKPKEKSSPWRDILKEKGVKGLLSLLKQLANAGSGGAKKLFRHLVIRECSLHVSAGGEDAAQAAIKYGYLCAAVYPAAGAVISNTKCKHHDIQVLCNFDNQETTFQFHGKCSIQVLFLLAAGWTVLYRFLKSQIKAKIQIE